MKPRREYLPSDLELERKAEGHRFIPPLFIVEKFKIPKSLKRFTVKGLQEIADTVKLSELGIVIPKNVGNKKFFELGLRHGLKTNRKNDPKLHFRDSFSWGFVWAKTYYKRFAPTHPLACSGSFEVRFTV